MSTDLAAEAGDEFGDFFDGGLGFCRDVGREGLGVGGWRSGALRDGVAAGGWGVAVLLWLLGFFEGFEGEGVHVRREVAPISGLWTAGLGGGGVRWVGG